MFLAPIVVLESRTHSEISRKINAPSYGSMEGLASIVLWQCVMRRKMDGDESYMIVDEDSYGDTYI